MLNQPNAETDFRKDKSKNSSEQNSNKNVTRWIRQ